MNYEVVKNPTREHHRMASPYEGDAIEAVKGGSGDPAARRINRRFTVSGAQTPYRNLG